MTNPSKTCRGILYVHVLMNVGPSIYACVIDGLGFLTLNLESHACEWLRVDEESFMPQARNLPPQLIIKFLELWRDNPKFMGASQRMKRKAK